MVPVCYAFLENILDKQMNSTLIWKTIMSKNEIALIQVNFYSVNYLKSFFKFLDSPFCCHVGLVPHWTTLASD